MEPEWTISELKNEVRRALSVDYVPAASARVRAVPDARTIRYYTTLGLLDRPARLRGRTALYARRHLLQLVAIKRLQAEGQSLSEIQARLAGLDDRGLEGVAELPDPDAIEEEAAPERAGDRGSFPGGSAPQSPPGTSSPSRSATQRDSSPFWAVVPAAITPTREAHDVTPVSTHTADEEPHAEPLVGITLADGVTLLLHTRRQLAGDDLQAIQAASGSLLRALSGILDGSW